MPFFEGNNPFKKIFNHKILLIIVIIIFIILSAGAFFLLQSNPAKPEALSLLENENIFVDEWGRLIAEPENNQKRSGIIFYPGGNIKGEAYLPLASSLSNKGYKVIIVPMPFDLAVFNKDAAIDVINKYNNIDRWLLSGHSLGGAMAADLITKHSEKFSALILLASYPSQNSDLSSTDLEVLSITASKDNVLNQEKYTNSKKNLPSDTVYGSIEGGNHAQFGQYGSQKGDGKATISSEEQIKQTVNIIDDFFKENIEEDMR